MAPLELVYKQVDELDLYLDVYVPSSATPSAPVPVILWWHGGGLIQVSYASVYDKVFFNSIRRELERAL